MTTDRQLTKECRRIADCTAHVTEQEKQAVNELCKRYEDACVISRGSDKQRAKVWSDKAVDLSERLQRWYQRIVGVPWRDMSAVPRGSGKKKP